jgi:hypothetical protein
MYLPDYKGGSIVNLMSSIKIALGGKAKYKPLRNFDTKELKNKNIILLIIDGLGYEFLKKHGKNTIFENNLQGKMTSVFPSTTATATTTLTVGEAPQQHGLTGWFMYLKEIGAVTAVLPFITRSGGVELEKKVPYEKIFNQKSFFEDLKVKSYIFRNAGYAFSAHSKIVSRGAKIIAFTTVDDFFNKIKKTVLTSRERIYINAYWGQLDGLTHRLGTNSEKTIAHLKLLDRKIKKIAKLLEDTNTTIIITSDHGLIDTKNRGKVIRLEKHPKLKECLTLPFCGDPRLVHCYVRPEKARQFEKYIKEKLRHACEIRKSKELLDKNYFGLFRPNKKLIDRIGDYILIMKENYIMRDCVLEDTAGDFIGNHGGVSREEMLVPLIVIEI